MTKRIGGSRRKTRSMFTKPLKRRGKISVTRFLQKLENGTKVLLKADPAVQSALYFRRFHGLIGTICGRRGHCYEVKVMNKNQERTLVVHPVHLHKC